MTCSVPNPMTRDYEIIPSTSPGQDEIWGALRLELPGWDLALTLSSRSSGLTPPAHHFLCF